MSIVQNERTALAQVVTAQPDGPGKRIGKLGELTLIGNVLPGGAVLFRAHLPQFQAEPAYWEGRVGTVKELRVLLFDNDTRYLVTVVYDGDFKPYFEDIKNQAGAWLDMIGDGVFEGYKKLNEPGAAGWVVSHTYAAEFFYASNPDVTVRDVTKMKKLSQAVNQLLEAAS